MTRTPGQIARRISCHTYMHHLHHSTKNKKRSIVGLYVCLSARRLALVLASGRGPMPSPSWIENTRPKPCDASLRTRMNHTTYHIIPSTHKTHTQRERYTHTQTPTHPHTHTPTNTRTPTHPHTPSYLITHTPTHQPTHTPTHTHSRPPGGSFVRCSGRGQHEPGKKRRRTGHTTTQQGTAVPIKRKQGTHPLGYYL